MACGNKLVQRQEDYVEAERRQVTVLFSDLSGYTAMSEKLDPEDVRDIMSTIFQKTSEIVAKYEGQIDKLIGDAVMVLFGIPDSHEDDPVRAIKAAMEIHRFVDEIAPRHEKRIGRNICMHTGINTGVVVSGEIDLKMGKEKVLGDTINLASRLTDFARSGEIVVGKTTHYHTARHVDFEALKPLTVKGKSKQVEAFRVKGIKEKPESVHRISGMRSGLIGRGKELASLKEAVGRLEKGKGTIFTITGEAGSGKSRLVDDLKESIEDNRLSWREAHAHAYSHSIPFSLWIDFFSHLWHIEESDTQEGIRSKIESAIENLNQQTAEIAPFIGSLYSLPYPETADIDPGFLKGKLTESIETVLSILSKQERTILYFEDLQWADPSSVELLRSMLEQIKYPVLFICVSRPLFSLLSGARADRIQGDVEEIRLTPLSAIEQQAMVESLLQTDMPPGELVSFINSKTEGNPFYVEEVVNNLIESAILVKEERHWKLTSSLDETNVPSTIQGVISARLDRLDREKRGILQVASVIGRTFYHSVLREVSRIQEDLEESLSDLCQIDLIRIHALDPEMEYIFKHALMQDVVYGSLLKSDRRNIHERIALIMERIFTERLGEFYETIAYHYSKAGNVEKAIDYLMKSGEKSLARYAAEEAHQYYQEAYELLVNKAEQTEKDRDLLFDLLDKWGLVFYYYGDFKRQYDVFKKHESAARSLPNKAKSGMFFAWIGQALIYCGNHYDAHRYLNDASELGQEANDRKVVAYACCWLSWLCCDMGKFNEGITNGERALEIARSLEHDQYLIFKSLCGISYNYSGIGDVDKTLKYGRTALEYGSNHSNIRAMVVANEALVKGYFGAGDFPKAVKHAQEAVRIAKDVFYYYNSLVFLMFAQLYSGNMEEAEDAAKKLLLNAKARFVRYHMYFAKAVLGVVSVYRGELRRGFCLMKEANRVYLNSADKYFHLIVEAVIGEVFLGIIESTRPVSLAIILKNILFCLTILPFAKKRSREHLLEAIRVAEQIGSKGLLAQAYEALGRLHHIQTST